MMHMKRGRLVAAGACFLHLSGHSLSDSQNMPSAPHVHILTVSPSGGQYSEPSIAINPRNPKHVVVVFQGGRKPQGTATAAYSNDGGETFTQASGTDNPNWKVLGDVSVTFDNRDNAYVCSIAFDKLGTSSYWANGAGRNGIFVRRSRDGGTTWDAMASSVKSFPKGTESDIQFEDEPRIYADNNLSSPYAGNLYVGWVEWQLTQSVIFFSRSIDEGKTWSVPVRISTKVGLPRDDNGGLGGYTQATGSDGAIYAAWTDGKSIVLAKSTDGGLTFSPSRSAIATGPPYFGDVPGIARVNGFPVLAMDVRKGHTRLYVCWSDYTNGDIDVFFSASGDLGNTWSQPVRVNNDSIHDGKDQFFQWMAVDPVTGKIFIDFYDRRADPANLQARLAIACSSDGGRTFRNYALSEETFNPRNAFLGDYTWLDAFNNHVIAAWTETEPGMDGTETKRATARTVIKVGQANFQ